jgi:hypothetical protein
MTEPTERDDTPRPTLLAHWAVNLIDLTPAQRDAARTALVRDLLNLLEPGSEPIHDGDAVISGMARRARPEHVGPAREHR